MKSLKSILTVTALAVGLSACGGGGGGGNGGGGGGGSYKTWYDFFGHACGSLKPDCTYANSYGSEKANWANDPNYSYFASASWANVFDTDLGYYRSAYGYFGINGVFYDYYSGRAINEGADEVGNDVLGGALQEDQVIVNAGTQFAAKHGLSAEVGIKAAKAVNEINKIGKTRERTKEDLSKFTERVLGVKMDKIEAAIQKNDKAAMDDMLGTAAKHWETSPENMRQIIHDIYQQ